MSDQRRRQRREIRLLQRESTWLQKALFALGKVEEVREKLAETREEEADDPYFVEVGGEKVPLGSVEDALQERVQTLLDEVRERRRAL